MDHDHWATDEREEPPAVTALLLRGSRWTGSVFRRAAATFEPLTWLRLWAGVTILGSTGIFALTVVRAPDLTGALTGLGGAFAFAFLSGAVGVFLFMAGHSRPAARPVDEQRADGLTEALAPTLRELALVRADIIRQVKARSRLRVPLGMAIAGSISVYGSWTGDSEAPPLILSLLVGAIGGEMWAAYRLSKEYRRLYKDRVLPLLAAQFGDLTYRRPSRDAVRKLLTFGIVQERGAITAEDELVGTHRGLPLSIIEARVEKGSGDDKQTLFDGLLVDFELPRTLTATTVIATDRGLLGNMAEQRRMRGLTRVRLEDPHFEKRFEVYGSDQVEARALLTPAFMERFLDLATRSDFAVPGAWAEGRRLVIALPRHGRGRLFEPPAYWQPAGGKALVRLSDDIAAVLDLAGTVIDLDFWASGRARVSATPATPS